MVLKKLFKFLSKTNKPQADKRKKPLKKKKARKAFKKVIKKKAQSSIKPKAKKEELVAEIVHYFSKIGVAVLKLKTTLKIKDKIHVKGFTTDFKQSIQSMQIDHNPVAQANKGKEVGIKIKGKARQGDKVFKI